ncbi:2-polyprenyl-6-methoxyphenol hydroxylase-like FAD-dependent oxidoreductase [Sphingomonas vulcanisoli]|uniref:2-polyprenyl-6-methoxyphenol hydroxylase-like FAD-dependent oxidoreductase n=1 Tax=Sphingomonas vulcanisoli TaxID=1658060 RepID=A0ABX0TQN6_9SPHN|nr:FAD-dependent monooxygenase [Sphingomonas vulcanisoli]NIJ06702.1 2-polyprenyl-6-methoxyphenol hydroxylase-like FAD-dependent oxidoreductase [Sphingomonas vulcanisoli]
MIVQKVLVVGAGLAGLSAAIALAQRGVQVTIATLDPRAEGTSITITNRAVDAVEALGVLDACLAEGLTPADGKSIFSAVWDGAGNPVPVPTSPIPPTRLPAYIAIYRPDLSRILTDAAEAAGVTIRAGVSFTALEDKGSHVDVAFTDGARDRFDLVVGADGAHSAVRRVIHPGIAPIYTGWMSFRLVLEDGPDGPAGFYTLPAGSGMLATVRLPGNRLYLAAGKQMENRRIDQAEAVALLDTVLAPYSAPLIRAISNRLQDQPKVFARPFDYVLVPSPWHRGRVTVIGDAAHATTPNLASGGSIALEDGVVLAEELEKADSVAGALDAFMARRYARCAMVVETSLAMMRRADDGDPAGNAALRAQAMAELVKPY